MTGFPAAAMNCLSGVISNRLTCESGYLMMREQTPEGASQKRILWSKPAVAKTTLIIFGVLETSSSRLDVQMKGGEQVGVYIIVVLVVWFRFVLSSRRRHVFILVPDTKRFRFMYSDEKDGNLAPTTDGDSVDDNGDYKLKRHL
jgi:hypothetical protein